MADMTPFWEAEIPRLLAKVAQLSFDAVERSTDNERLRAALGSAGYARALKECDELRDEIERLRANDKVRVTVHEAEIRRLGIAMGAQAAEIERLTLENWQLKGALGYPVPGAIVLPM